MVFRPNKNIYPSVLTLFVAAFLSGSANASESFWERIFKRPSAASQAGEAEVCKVESAYSGELKRLDDLYARWRPVYKRKRVIRRELENFDLGLSSSLFSSTIRDGRVNFATDQNRWKRRSLLVD